MLSRLLKTQDASAVVVWQDGKRTTHPVSAFANGQWEYAALSANAYYRSLLWTEKTGMVDDHIESASRPVLLTGWEPLHFLDAKVIKELLLRGVYVEAYVTTQQPRRIAVVFEGSTSERWKWYANARWFLRFLPGPLWDAYSIVGSTIVQRLHDALCKLGYRYNTESHGLTAPGGEAVTLLATGHSLGGGLAQYFAYTFNQATNENPWCNTRYLGPRVAEVFAFNTTPVTGWYAAPEPPRTHNTTGLVIHRIFEHGEALAYLRLMTSRFVSGGSADPRIVTYRYNFLRSANIAHSHAMRPLADALRLAAV